MNLLPVSLTNFKGGCIKYYNPKTKKNEVAYNNFNSTFYMDTPIFFQNGEEKRAGKGLTGKNIYVLNRLLAILPDDSNIIDATKGVDNLTCNGKRIFVKTKQDDSTVIYSASKAIIYKYQPEKEKINELGVENLSKRPPAKTQFFQIN